jgi:hypothetical protein
MSSNPVPIPISDPIARPPRKEYVEKRQKDPQEGMVTQPWIDFFTDQEQLTGQAPSRVASANLTTQSASIGATDLTGGSISAGLYRITYYMEITQAAGVSSSITVSFDWSSGGVAKTFPGTAETGNTTTTYQSGIFMIRSDNLSPVRYSTTYVSVGAPVMEYSLDVLLEVLPQ